jgi:hypothetical protein
MLIERFGRLVIASLLLTGILPAASIIAYDSPVNSGNQSWTGSIGQDFNVLKPILVDQLGVFDDNPDGLAGPLTVQLYNRATQSVLAFITVPIGTPGTKIRGNRLLPLATPLSLMPGFQGSIVAYGFDPVDNNATTGGATRFGILNDGGGALSFGGYRYASPGVTTFPTITGPHDFRYGAGTFAFAVVPEPGTYALFGVGLIALGLLRRKLR